MLKKMKKIVKDKDVCVLATVMDNVPHCSLMSYVPDRDCREIYMMTGRRRRSSATSSPTGR